MRFTKLCVALLLVAAVFAPGAAVFAAPLGSPTPVEQIHEGMFPEGSQQMVDYTHGVFVRRGPFTDYDSFTTLTRGTIVTVLEYSHKWVRVDTPSGQGWIYAGFLSRDMAAEPPLAPRVDPITASDRTPSRLLRAELFPIGGTATIDFTPALFVREGPGNDYAAFTTVSRGTVVTVLAYSRLWAMIDTPAGQGWVFSGFLSNDAIIAARAGQ